MQRPQRNTGQQGSRKPIVAIIGAMIIVTAGLIAFLVVRGAPKPEHAHVAAAEPLREHAVLARRETRPTLDPAQFDGKAALAYQVAREIPEILDQLQCYCACGRQYGHVSLLSCYADGHGST